MKVQMGQAKGFRFNEQITDTSMHHCTIAKMHQRTNELLQGIISQILKIKIQNVMTGGRLNWRKKHKKA